MAYTPVYSTQFIAWASETNPPAYNVPDGYVAVVRDISITSGGGSVIDWQVELGPAYAIFYRGQFTVESVGQSFHWEGRMVAIPGQWFAFASDGATDGVISGYLLSGPSA